MIARSTAIINKGTGLRMVRKVTVTPARGAGMVVDIRTICSSNEPVTNLTLSHYDFRNWT